KPAQIRTGIHNDTKSEGARETEGAEGETTASPRAPLPPCSLAPPRSPSFSLIVCSSLGRRGTRVVLSTRSPRQGCVETRPPAEYGKGWRLGRAARGRWRRRFQTPLLARTFLAGDYSRRKD